jgi:hypothetical protein
MRYCGWSVANLDALCDTLRYVDFAGVTGWALVIRQFDEAHDADPQWARQVADIIAQVYLRTSAPWQPAHCLAAQSRPCA